MEGDKSRGKIGPVRSLVSQVKGEIMNNLNLSHSVTVGTKKKGCETPQGNGIDRL